jgi:hypothetical protein
MSRLVTRLRSLWLVAAFFVATALAGAAPASRKFYDDDPIARFPEKGDASRAAPVDLELLYEYMLNLFVTSRHVPSGMRAQNLNTIDEVPDSGWFTNRIGARAVTEADIMRGPNAGAPPATEKWTIIREKSAGTNPGFTARDANGETWFVAFDHREVPEGGTGAVEVATKIFWALGYNQIETFVSTFDPTHASIDPKATLRRPSGDRTAFGRADLEELLDHAAKNPDGTYRISAGRLLKGKVLGPFRYEGTRPDDPNDLVPHEHRRELRALRAFGAWINLVDLKAKNTLDALEPEGTRSIVKHYMQDVGSTFGVANNPHEWDMGYEYFFDPPATERRFLTFGFGLSPWQTVKYTEHRGVGRFEGNTFDPRAWKPQTPTTAYLEMRDDDAFWAARRIAAFTDDLIRAAVRTAQYSDPAAEQHLVAVLMQRRDVMARTYLTAVNPVVDPRLGSNGVLTVSNAAVDAHVADAPREYAVMWHQFDNITQVMTPIGMTRSASATIDPPPALPAAAGSYLALQITAESVNYPAWHQPVMAYFRRDTGGWTLVGLERQP